MVGLGFLGHRTCRASFRGVSCWVCSCGWWGVRPWLHALGRLSPLALCALGVALLAALLWWLGGVVVVAVLVSVFVFHR